MGLQVLVKELPSPSPWVALQVSGPLLPLVRERVRELLVQERVQEPYF